MSTIKCHLKGLKYTMKILIQLLFSCNCEIAANFLSEAEETMSPSRTWVKLAWALAIKVVPILLFQSVLPRGKGHLCLAF